jgi:signal transduction histidine kinase
VLLRKRAEDELGRQAIELARSNADLRLFAELTAHELQQPLHAVVQMLARALDRAPDREALLQTALSSATRLQEAIEGLLRYAAIREPVTQRISLDDVVDRVVADLALELDRVELVREPLPVVEADAAQLQAVVRNLLANAARYRSNRPLEIEIGSADGAFYVRDNGRGVDPKDRQRIFELFRRGTSAGDVEGVGLGLALTRRIIEAHGGEVWLESEPGAGTTFFFTLGFPATRP